MTTIEILGRLAAGPSSVPAHPALWLEMALRYPWLLKLTNAMRLDSTVLALAMLTFWLPSGLRWLIHGRGEALALRLATLPFGGQLAELVHPAQEGDGRRAGYLPLAIATLVFQARWFFDGLTELTRARMALAGQIGVLCALAFAVYAHGRKHRELTKGRAVLGFALMLAAGIGGAVVMK